MNKKDLFVSYNEEDAQNPQEIKYRDIILLESDNNKKGDLFNRLVSDVFYGLGFGEPQFNTPKPGREIDIVLRHRTEKRYAIVESKAQGDKVGGSDINKFMGAFALEKGRYEAAGNTAIGYFVSRTGFTGTAIEQEDERTKLNNGKKDLILLGPDEIIKELIQGRILCPLHKAIDTIGRVIDDSLSLCSHVDLIASELGWIWVLYYSQYSQLSATHYAFVYADGIQILNEIADVIAENTNSDEYPFFGLSYIKAPSKDAFDTQSAKEKYYEYLENELGEIQFEGMPTDKDAGAVKVNLESIFVPLRFNYKSSKEEAIEEEIPAKTNIKGVIDGSLRSAILAKPGGGKSTLIRRIALAFAYPNRREKVDDGLPDYDWLPIYIRCRDLGESATKSILEIISELVNRAEMTNDKQAFSSLVEDNLQNGQLLLLIDGLDEISSEKNRLCFVSQLRTFVSTYPTVHLLITSREAGFRTVADTIAGYCKQYSIASLEKKEIRLLSLKWHQAILGESGQAQTESDKVCEIILNDSRIISLAESPLLLTTLLFVKRWVGYLPTKKCRLYEEMIKLLLVTWNAAGHERLDMDESEPQLAFVAYYMTTQGQQKITRDKLEKCIIDARKAMPELLGYTNISPSKFIDQVEERSSLLIQSGFEENDKGRSVESYEFSHLSFQEYLTAKAIAESWIPDSSNNDLLNLLLPHLNEEHWIEVIPLAAVISGRKAKSLIEHLVSQSENADAREIEAKYTQARKTNTFENIIQSRRNMDNNATFHLANCIAGEVPISQDLLEKAIISIVRGEDLVERKSLQPFRSANVFTTIIKSKYGSKYCETVKTRLFNYLDADHLFQFSSQWINIWMLDNEYQLKLDNILELLKKDDRTSKITGTLLLMQAAYEYRDQYKANNATLLEIFAQVLNVLKEDDTLSIFSSLWCISWSGHYHADIIPHEIVPDIANRVIEIWLSNIGQFDLKRVSSWAVYSICMPDLHLDDTPGLKNAIEDNYNDPKNDFDRKAAIHLAALNNYWTKHELKERIGEADSRFLREIGLVKSKEPQELFP